MFNILEDILEDNKEKDIFKATQQHSNINKILNKVEQNITFT